MPTCRLIGKLPSVQGRAEGEPSLAPHFCYSVFWIQLLGPTACSPAPSFRFASCRLSCQRVLSLSEPREEWIKDLTDTLDLVSTDPLPFISTCANPTAVTHPMLNGLPSRNLLNNHIGKQSHFAEEPHFAEVRHSIALPPSGEQTQSANM